MNSNLSRPLPGAGPAESYNPFVDPAGLGVRTIGSDTFSGELLEVLRLTPDLGTPAMVQPLVRERCALFGTEPVNGLASVLRVEATFDGRTEVWSRLAEGFRLSAVLEWTEARGAAPTLEAALTVGDRLLGALASLQGVDNAAGASGHGAVAIDQIVVSETGGVTLTDYAFGTALAALQWPRERLWRRFRIAMPPSAGLARFDHRVDVTQAGVVICSLLAGRVFKADEYPRALGSMVAEAMQRSCAGLEVEERNRLGVWLRAVTEFEPRSAFPSAAAAREALCDGFGSRLDDTKAVRRWLRGARGIADPEPASPAINLPAPEPVSTADAVAVAAPVPDPQPAQPPAGSRLRRWISPR